MGCAPSKNANLTVVNPHSRPQQKPDDGQKLVSLQAENNNSSSLNQSPKESEEPIHDEVRIHSAKKASETPKKTVESHSKSSDDDRNQKTTRFRPKSAGIPFKEPTGLALSYEKASQLHPKDPDEMWAIVNCTSDREGIHIEPTKNRKGWRTIRVFVSSTFKDFHQEREVLVKEVCRILILNFLS